MSKASALARAIGADGALNVGDVLGLGSLASLNTVGTTQLDDSAVTSAKVASVVGTKVTYNNAVSGISASNMQEAVDYLKTISGGASSGQQASYSRQKFTATANQTTFTVAYTVGYLEVYLNGVLLDISDYTANNGTSIVLASGAAVGDELVTIALDSFAIAELLRVTAVSASAPTDSIVVDASGNLTGYVKTSGATMTGGLVMGGNSRVLGSSAAFALRKSSAFTGQLYLDFQDQSGTEIGYLGYGSAGNDKLTIANTLSEIQVMAGSALGIVVNTTGRVTKPNNPAFFSYGLPSGLNNYANAVPAGGLTFATNMLNQGNRWDGKTFTADVAGVYFIHFSQMYHHGGGDISFMIQLNGNSVAYSNPYGKDSQGYSEQWSQNEVTWIGSMAVGDRITFTWGASGDASSYLYGSGLYTRAMGHLIG